MAQLAVLFGSDNHKSSSLLLLSERSTVDAGNFTLGAVFAGLGNTAPLRAWAVKSNIGIHLQTTITVILTAVVRWIRIHSQLIYQKEMPTIIFDNLFSVQKVYDHQLNLPPPNSHTFKRKTEETQVSLESLLPEVWTNQFLLVYWSNARITVEEALSKLSAKGKLCSHIINAELQIIEDMGTWSSLKGHSQNLKALPTHTFLQLK